MNNEPVAWMYERPNGSAKLTFVREPMAGTVVTEKPLYTHPAKTLTDEERSKLIGTLKWAEDLLRVAGHDEASSDAQDCIMLLRKAQEK